MSPVSTDNETAVFQLTTTNPNEGDDYDHPGAMYFTIAVVLIYGLSIVALIATHMKGEGRDEKEECRQVSKYFNDRDQMRRKGELERLMWLQSKVASRQDSSDADWSSSSDNINLIDSTVTDWGAHRYTSVSQTTAPISSELSLILEEDVFVQPRETLTTENVIYHSDHLCNTRIPPGANLRLQNPGNIVDRPTDLSIQMYKGGEHSAVHQSADKCNLTEDSEYHAPTRNCPGPRTVQNVREKHNDSTGLNRKAMHVFSSHLTGSNNPCEAEPNSGTVEHIWKLRSELDC